MLSALYLNLFLSLLNICCILQANIFRACKIQFKVELYYYSEVPSALGISWMVYLLQLSFSPLFWYIFLACYSTKLTWFSCTLDILCVSLKFLFQPTSCLKRYLIRSISFQQLNKWMHYRMIEVCVIFFINFNVFNVLNPFPNYFYMTIILTLCRTEGIIAL